MAEGINGVYLPRNPKALPLYGLVESTSMSSNLCTKREGFLFCMVTEKPSYNVTIIRRNVLLSPTAMFVLWSTTWNLHLDPDDMGVCEAGYRMASSDSVRLPGSLTKNNVGNEISVKTR